MLAGQVCAAAPAEMSGAGALLTFLCKQDFFWLNAMPDSWKETSHPRNKAKQAIGR